MSDSLTEDVLELLKKHGYKEEEKLIDFMDRVLRQAWWVDYITRDHAWKIEQGALAQVEVQEQRDKIRELKEELRHKKDELNDLYEKLYTVVKQRDEWRNKAFVNLDNPKDFNRDF